MSKQQLGQFFSTNAEYILQGLESFIVDKNICDPFVGAGDLLKWANKNGARKLSAFDIDTKENILIKVEKNDSLLNPQKYDFVITNPPYLYVNKANLETKQKYFKNTKNTDLYQISLEKIMNSKEGIVIVPINFLSAENSSYIRNIFFEKFEILKLNYFTEQVFDDTSYNVIAFYYCLKKDKNQTEMKIPATIFPEKIKTTLILNKKTNWTIGGDFLQKIKFQKNILGIHRLTQSDLEIGEMLIPVALGHLKNQIKVKISKDYYQNIIQNNILLLKAIDTGTVDGKIRLENIKEYGIEALISKSTSRNQIHIVFKKSLKIEEQLKLIELFNQEIETAREKYFSLFMTNFRDKGRKRISFDFAYKLLNYLYQENFMSQNELF